MVVGSPFDAKCHRGLCCNKVPIFKLLKIGALWKVNALDYQHLLISQKLISDNFGRVYRYVNDL